jgi:methylated-DNA-[protein]-cysteine S-methyltransferase
MGALRLCSDGTALTGIDFAGESGGRRPAHGDEPEGWVRRDELPVLKQTAAELREYFAGRRTAFSVPLALAGTEFQRAVWAQLCLIPYGQTWSYVELARRVGKPQASRAVGSANGKNPVAIIVPCHRVIGATGQLTGYGGGLPRKQQLLQLEQAPASGRQAGRFG